MRRKTKDPGDFYLVEQERLRGLPLAEKCACPTGTAGCWAVQKEDGSVYTFDPPTQLQKDIWLGSGGADTKPERKEKLISMLRWVCFGKDCTASGGIQMP